MIGMDFLSQDDPYKEPPEDENSGAQPADDDLLAGVFDSGLESSVEFGEEAEEAGDGRALFIVTRATRTKFVITWNSVSRRWG
jgi:hypothetical protein